jgi:YHS domain-containing protein
MNLSQAIKSAFAVSALTLSSLTFAANIDMSADENDVAISGYDTVSYFTDGKPTHGSSKYTATYKHAIYQFSNAENRNTFRANPEYYAPQYGGYCAMGVALEKKLTVDPTAWYIEENKLYLNLNKAVQKKWLSDVSGNLETSEHNWPEIKNQDAAVLNEG